MSAVVFLDIDGVLNNEAWYAAVERDTGIVSWSPAIGRKLLDPERVARLQRLCDATGAAVVIVSGWRRWAEADAIAAVLADAGLRAPVLGAVGGLRMSGDLRAMAAVEWLDRHPEVTRWVVLDDTARMWDGMRVRGRRWRSHLIAPQDGLTDDDVERAIKTMEASGG
jgi:hypothetical protein